MSDTRHHALYDDEPPFDAHEDAAQHADRTPTNRQSEQALLGTLLAYPETAAYAQTLIDRDDLYYPHHQTIWDAIHAVSATGALPEPVLVLEHLERAKQLGPIGGGPYLLDCQQAGQHGQLDQYARIVRDTARLRSAMEASTRIRQAITTARIENVDRALDQAVTVLDDAYARHGATRSHPAHHVETIDDLLAGEQEDTYDWVIPGLIERQERVILTAEEGAGKSTLLRQIAIQAAAGIHPFQHHDMQPITVLHIDVENTRRQSRRRYRPMRIQAGAKLEPDRLRIELRTAGVDLTQETDRDWLLDTARHVRPDLLLIGPIYKLANGDPTEEKSAKPVAMAIDAVRAEIDCAVILEAHAAKAPTGQKRRPHEPYGWSGWLRWPEVGLWLDKDGSLSPWRGAREERSWPTHIQRGGTWPWSAVLTDDDRRWLDIQRARLDEGDYLSIRDLIRTTNFTKAQIERVIGPGMPYRTRWEAMNGTSPQTTIDEDLT